MSAAGVTPVMLVESDLPDGTHVFYFVRCLPNKANALQEALVSAEAVNVDEYGEILHSGWGEVTEDDYVFVQEEYGVKFNP